MAEKIEVIKLSKEEKIQEEIDRKVEQKDRIDSVVAAYEEKKNEPTNEEKNQGMIGYIIALVESERN
jgi:hypothetical protein